MPTEVAQRRHFGFDLLRVFATYMVMQIHTGEFEYIGSTGVIHSDGARAVGWINSLFRSSVPLFVMISGFFLFPVGDERVFFRKRFTRVLTPFIFWCVVYAFYFYFQGQASLTTTLGNIAKIPVNYGTEVGHLWFVYMLMGIYLMAPVLSPWVVSARRGSMQLFLVLWAVALSIPYIHLYFPQIWGEAFWNSTPMLYYFSGFMGYAVLAAYIRRFCMAPSLRVDCAAIGMIIVGYAITATGFLHRLPTENSLPKVELTWNFSTINVALMAAGLFLLFRNLQKDEADRAVGKLVRDVSLKSYAMYLAHIIVLNSIHALLAPAIPNAFVRVPSIALITFVATYCLVKILSLVPGSKYLVG
jgi:surface polysaccharide O-acyltransferase-like enzyme